MSEPTRIEELRKEIVSLCGNCDRPDKEQLGEIILLSMALGFSYGINADKSQGEWVHSHEGTIAEGLYCSNCGKHGHGEKFYSNCGARMKGADDETD